MNSNFSVLNIQKNCKRKWKEFNKRKHLRYKIRMLRWEFSETFIIYTCENTYFLFTWEFASKSTHRYPWQRKMGIIAAWVDEADLRKYNFTKLFWSSNVLFKWFSSHRLFEMIERLINSYDLVRKICVEIRKRILTCPIFYATSKDIVEFLEKYMERKNVLKGFS